MTCLVRLSCRPPTPLPPAPPSPSSLCRLPPPSRPSSRLRCGAHPASLRLSSSPRLLAGAYPAASQSASVFHAPPSSASPPGSTSSVVSVPLGWCGVWAVLGVWLPLARFRCCGQHGVVRFRQLTQIKHRRLDISVRHNACSAPGGDDRGRRARMRC
jgi:hypothetical protein